MKQANITAEAVRKDRTFGALEQSRINTGLQAWLDGRGPYGDRTLELVAAAAEERVGAERFPQYRGYFSGWKVVRVTRSVKTKMGQAFLAGDLTLAKFEPRNERDDLPAYWAAFSFRNGATTSVGLDVEEVSR